jgi:tetratricopeptide (TPR) repeat protein
MPHGFPRVLLALALLAPASGLGHSARASTIPSVHGLGGAAVVQQPSGLSFNPALLTTADRPGLWSSLQGTSRFDALQAESVLPTLQGNHWGFGLLQQRGVTPDTWWQRARLGLARSLANRWSAGGSVDLWNGDSQRDFAASAGVVFDAGPSGSATRMHLAAVARQLVEPLSTATRGLPRRSVDLAAAVQRPLTEVWTLSSSAGLRLGPELRRRASVAAVLRWRDRLECGVGLQDAQPGLALGWRHRSLSIGWSLRDAEPDIAQELSIGWSWGATLSQRHQREAQQDEADFDARVEAAMQRFEAVQIEDWKRIASECLENGALDRAASYFSMVLTSEPDDSDAQDGFRRSRHARFVAEADTLMQHKDYGGAARALEEALQIIPADSSSAVRLREVRRAARLAFRQQSDAEQLFGEGINAFATQQYPQAISAFRGVLALDPEHHMARSYLTQAEQSHRNRIDKSLSTATQRMQAEDFDGARKLVRRILGEEADHPRALKLLASIDESEKHVRDRQRLEEQQRLAAERARQQEAESVVEDAAPVPPSQEVLDRYEEGIRLYRTGDMMAAMQAWEEVARKAPHHQDVDSYLLRVYRVAGLERYTEGRLRDAVDIWQKALQLDPENRQLSRYLNQAQTKLKRAQRSGGSE